MQRRLADVTCRVIDATQQPTAAVVLCHGFGAPGDDLVPLGDELHQVSESVEQRVRFYFPEAPLDLRSQGMPGGRAWWWLDINRMVAAAEQGRLRDLANEIPEGLAEARAKLLAVIEAIREETQLPLARILVGGFSQGAMLATEVALRLSEPVAGVMAFSGNLLAEPDWLPLMRKHAPLSFLISHGRQDPILPFGGAEALAKLLAASGHQVRFLPFEGPHTIPLVALRAFAEWLVEIAEAPSDNVAD